MPDKEREHSSLRNPHSLSWNPGKRMRDDSDPFFDRNDLVHWNVDEFIDLSTWPVNHKRVYLRSLSEPEVNSRIAGRHVARSTFRLLDAHETFGNQLQRRTNAITVGLCAYQEHFEPVICAAAIVS